jgi:ADP-L-glycero-D-manno-heptose 6-epimerase
MIVVTGAAGFIGSVVAGKLLNTGFDKLVIVDDFNRPEKGKNHEKKSVVARVERDLFADWLEKHAASVSFVIHLGARTDTTEFDKSVFDRLNLNYTKTIWTSCARHQIPFIYASSAATYGSGELGYKDEHDLVGDLKPLNPYGISKNDFDLWALLQKDSPPFWAGLKFFNVYGPNEYHKGRMASVIFHAYNQIRDNGKVQLFRSHRIDYENGKQLRDFVYVMDVAEVILFLMEKRPANGLYNLGTGQARTFIDLVRATYAAVGIPENISFVDTPADIRDKYQYFTEADMSKLKRAGYSRPFTSLEDGIGEYVGNFLSSGSYY